jgi:hypothetical protein
VPVGADAAEPGGVVLDRARGAIWVLCSGHLR